MGKLLLKVSSLRRAGVMCCGLGAVTACAASGGGDPAGVDPPKPSSGSSSASGTTKSAPKSAPPVAAPKEPAKPQTLAYFEGDVDVARKTVMVRVHPPSADTSDASLPYGFDAGAVYFHTCPTPAVSYTDEGSGGVLSGLVQAVNNTGGTVMGMTVKIDSTTDTGNETFTTTPDGAGAYGAVPSTGDTSCSANTLTWHFTQAATTSFSFHGEADGLPCDPSCATCDGTGSDDCTSCPAGDYTLPGGFPGICVANCATVGWSNPTTGAECICENENGCPYPS